MTPTEQLFAPKINGISMMMPPVPALYQWYEMSGFYEYILRQVQQIKRKKAYGHDFIFLIVLNYN
jgi:hypothetical protein